MKKFIVIVAILICCIVYAIVKLNMSENQNVSQNQKAYKQTEETQSAKQTNAGNTDKAIHEEDSGSAVPVVQVDVPAAQVEAVTKAFNEFISAIKSEDYEQVWTLTSEVAKPETSFEEFKKGIADVRNELVKAIMHPESAIIIEGRGVGLRITALDGEAYYFFFIQEDGQWKFNGPQPAREVDASKE